VGDLAIFLVIIAVVTVASVWFGIVVIAPRLGRALDRQDDSSEDIGDRPA
jgi:hypothetical protein